MNSLATNPHVEGGPYPEKMLQQLVWFAEIIDRAVQGGWNTNLLEDDWHVHAGVLGTAEFCFPRPAENRVTHLELFSIIYDHTFAKALWGEGTRLRGYTITQPLWQYYLRQAVLMADPLEFIYSTIRPEESE